MANPTLLTHTTPYGRKTVLDLKTYIAKLIGVEVDQFTVGEAALLLTMMDDEVNEWHIFSSKRFTEQTVDLTWDGVDSSKALPLDFAEAAAGHMRQIDASGNSIGKVFFKSEVDHNDGFVEGTSGADVNDLPYARLWGEETSTRKRVIHVYPTPAANVVHRLLYYSYAETLTGDSDVLEAPVAFHQAIQYGVAARWLEVEGDAEASARMEAKKAQKLSLLTAPVQDETKKKRRALEFERDLGGYPAFIGADTPQVRGNYT